MMILDELLGACFGAYVAACCAILGAGLKALLAL
jgi:hypothetical protein